MSRKIMLYTLIQNKKLFKSFFVPVLYIIDILQCIDIF